jgi:hypothetical protein
MTANAIKMFNGPASPKDEGSAPVVRPKPISKTVTASPDNNMRLVGND